MKTDDSQCRAAHSILETSVLSMEVKRPAASEPKDLHSIPLELNTKTETWKSNQLPDEV